MNEDQTENIQEDFRNLFKDLSRGGFINTAAIERFNEQIEQFNTQANKSWEQFLKLIQTSYMDATQKTIETSIQNGTIYKTIIKINGDIKNELPNPTPSADDPYWSRHNQLVNEALALRKEIVVKTIEIVGTTIQKVVNPISP